MAEPYLDIQSAEGSRKLPVGEQPITIGRHSTNLVVLAGDGQASRYHCVIEKVSDGIRVRDLDSSNGTRLNGKLVKTAMLGDGDTVTVGKTTLKLVAPQLAAAGARKGGGVGAGGGGAKAAVATNGDGDYDVEVEVEVEVEEEPIENAAG